MVTARERGLLLYIIKHCNRIINKIDGVDIDTFNTDEDIQEIVCFNVFQIGELTKSLSKEFVQEYNGVPWSKIAGMRDRIGHGYGTIEMKRVYQTATTDIVPLKDYCKEILNN